MPEPSVSGLPAAAAIAQRLIARGETVAVAEGAAGGLISAALLAVPGASAYFVGGAVIYTVTARRTLLGVQDADMVGMRPASEAYATLLARRIREVHGATWGLAETGASGPTGNRYGDPAGHACFFCRGIIRPRRHAAHRQRRPGGEHARLHGGRAESSRPGSGRRGGQELRP